MQARLAGLADGLGPVGAPVAGVLLIILGILVVVYPSLLAWLAGLGLVLTGVALLPRPSRRPAGGAREPAAGRVPGVVSRRARWARRPVPAPAAEGLGVPRRSWSTGSTGSHRQRRGTITQGT